MSQSPEQIFDRIVDACEQADSFVCAGLDPHPTMLPAALAGPREIDGWKPFLFATLEALAGVVPVVKPQVAFFERWGAEGLDLYFQTIREAHRRGFLVVGDIKRSDIGSTARAYAEAHLGPTDGSAADVVTVNPYLGIDGVRPFLEVGRPAGRGVFVLARTSNPSASDFQDLQTDGVELYKHVGRKIQEWGSENPGRQGYGDCGAVVGATGPEEGAALREALPNTFFLVPGYGAQGGTAADVARTFGTRRNGALISSSRGILFAYRSYPDGERDFADAARQAAEEMRSSLREALAPAKPKGASADAVE